jgi:hypothetical protein
MQIFSCVICRPASRPAKQCRRMNNQISCGWKEKRIPAPSPPFVPWAPLAKKGSELVSSPGLVHGNPRLPPTYNTDEKTRSFKKSSGQQSNKPG